MLKYFSRILFLDYENEVVYSGMVTSTLTKKLELGFY